MLIKSKNRIPPFTTNYQKGKEKNMNDLAELLVIPAPGAGHLASTVEMAKLLVSRDSRLSITVLIFNFSAIPAGDGSSSSNPLPSCADFGSGRVKFFELAGDNQNDAAGDSSLGLGIFGPFFESHKPNVRDALRHIFNVPGAPRLAGIVLDMFCSPLTDVADEFAVPSYFYSTSSAGSLSLLLRLQALSDERGDDITAQFKNDPDSHILVPGFVNRLPIKVLPAPFVDKVVTQLFYEHSRRFRKAKGILVNTFMELESNIINSLSGVDKLPPVYPVGPVVSHNPVDSHRKAEIMTWLDKQPPSSVVFLCFGSMGSFGAEQVREIASALEQSGFRFLWSLRQKRESLYPSDCADPAEVLPAGFLDRTAERGKIIGWAPQTAVLAHPAVGGFVSHCGWNSILESLWSGVPIATWPIYAEQQVNAFQMVKELGLAVEITLDYRNTLGFESDESELDDVPLVKAEEIKRGIERLMESDSEIRKKVKEMSEKSQKALLPGGSTYISVSHFIDDVLTILST